MMLILRQKSGAVKYSKGILRNRKRGWNFSTQEDEGSQRSNQVEHLKARRGF